MKAALLAALLLVAGAAGAQPAGLCLARPIRFTHYEFGLIYASGYGGIDEDIRQELARRSGCRFDTQVLPRARTWLGLRSGEVDMAGSGVETPERASFVWFHHYLQEVNLVVLGPRVPASVQSFEQFMQHPELTLGGVRAFRYSPHYDRFVDDLAARQRLKEAAEPAGLFRMFAARRFDAFIASPILHLHHVRVLGLPAPQRTANWDPAGPTPSGLVLSKASFTEAQARQWGALIRAMLADGTVERIVVKHMGPVHGPASVYRPAPR